MKESFYKLSLSGINLDNIMDTTRRSQKSVPKRTERYPTLKEYLEAEKRKMEEAAKGLIGLKRSHNGFMS